MRTGWKPFLVCATILAAALVADARRAAAPKVQTLSVSVPRLRLEPGERVLAFEIQLTSGDIVRLPHIPRQWVITIDNDSPASASAKGQALVGVAFGSADFFSNFMVVRKDETWGLPFNLQWKVTVTRNDTYRTIELRMKDLVIAPAGSSR